MNALQQRLKDIVLADPDKFNRDELQPLFDYNWNDCLDNLLYYTPIPTTNTHSTAPIGSKPLPTKVQAPHI